jgi:hypothetical protein
MHFLLSAIFVFLPALAAAVPYSAQVLGTRIDISKRDQPWPLTDDGLVNSDAWNAQLKFAEACESIYLCPSMDADWCPYSKYNWTLTALLNAFNYSGVDVQAEATVQLSTSKSASVPLTDDSKGQLWQGSIQVGTPPVPFTGKCLSTLP